jgi:PKD repeat protein
MRIKKVVTFTAVTAITLTGFLVSAPAGNAAGNKITAPATAQVGKEVTVKSLFKAKQEKKRCFSPNVTWGDEAQQVGVTIDMWLWGCSGGVSPGSKPGSFKFVNQKDIQTHTYTSPGTYTITVTAGSGASGMERNWKPSKTGAVKGAKKLTKTITITGDAVTPVG